MENKLKNRIKKDAEQIKLDMQYKQALEEYLAMKKEEKKSC